MLLCHVAVEYMLCYSRVQLSSVVLQYRTAAICEGGAQEMLGTCSLGSISCYTVYTLEEQCKLQVNSLDFR